MQLESFDGVHYEMTNLEIRIRIRISDGIPGFPAATLLNHSAAALAWFIACARDRYRWSAIPSVIPCIISTAKPI